MPPLPSLPDLCKRLVLGHCSPLSFHRLRQVDRAWDAAATPFVQSQVVSAALQEDVLSTCEDPATIQRAYRRLVMFEKHHVERTAKLTLPLDGLRRPQFTADPTKLVATRWGSHLYQLDLTAQCAMRLVEGAFLYQWGSDRSELYAAEECGSLHYVLGVDEYPWESFDLNFGLPDITLGLSVDPDNFRFAAGGWGGTGYMGSLFDFTQRTPMPHAGEGTTMYEVLLVDNGAHVLHSGPGANLRLTRIEGPADSCDVPWWLEPARLRRVPQFAHPEVMAIDGGVCFIDFSCRPPKKIEALPASHRIVDVLPLPDSELWLTRDVKHKVSLWSWAGNFPLCVWRKRFRNPVTKLRAGAAPSTFAVQGGQSNLFLYSWQGARCWSLGQLTVGVDDTIETFDVSEDGRYALCESEQEGIKLKRIAPMVKNFDFWDCAPFAYYDTDH